MKRLKIINALFISLIFLWTSAAKYLDNEESREQFHIKPQNLSALGPLVSLNERPMGIQRQTRKRLCRGVLGGRCVKLKRSCPREKSLETEPGRPWCSKRRRCCYPDKDTSCQFKTLQERKEYQKLWPGRCGAEDDNCALDWVIGTPKNPPFMMFTTGKILLPQGEKGKTKINIEDGHKVIFSCSGSELEKFNKDHIEGVCEKGALKINGQKETLASVGCTKLIAPSVFEKSSSSGGPNKIKCAEKSLQIGYNTYYSTLNFFPMIEVCFRKEAQTTLSAMNKVYGKSLSAREAKIDPKFNANRFTVAMSTIYTEKNEKKLFDEILGGILKINFKDESFFSPGHLSPQSDFILKAGKFSSFYYLNTLPQWQKYNGGNWALVEQYIQDLAKNNDAVLEIYTGGSGILKKEPSDPGIFLAHSIQEKNDVPVPNLFWKVVTVSSDDNKVLKAVAFVINNNPLKGKGKPKEPCKDICEKLKDWISEKQLKILRREETGYTYCCNVDDLKKEDFPDLPAIGKGVPLLENLKKE